MLEKTARTIDRTLYPVSKILNGVGSGVILGMVILMTVNVILRYLFGRPIKGTVEFEEFMLVTVVFLGLSYAALEKRHVRIDFIVARFPEPAQAVINSITASLSAGLCFIMVWRCAIWAQHNWAHNSTSMLLQVPLFIFIYVTALGSALLFLVLLAECFHSLAEVAKSGQRWFILFALLLLALLGSGWLIWLKEPSSNALAVIAFVVLLVMLAFRMYISFAMMLVGFLGMSFLADINAGFHHMATVPYTITADYHLCVVPFFVLMGHLCAAAGISRDIYNTAYKWVGHFRGGLSMGTVVGCAGFGKYARLHIIPGIGKSYLKGTLQGRGQDCRKNIGFTR